MSRRVRYACEWDHSGYAVAGRRAVRALAASGVDVSWTPLLNTRIGRVPAEHAPGAPALLADRRDQGGPVDVDLLHCMPMSWGRLVAALPAARTIGHTVWETERVPQRWYTEIDPVDELWVPCRWNAEVFAAGGITKPVHVIPHVTADDEPEPFALDVPDDHLVFLALGAWDARKAPDLTIEAFLRAFTAEDPVTLVVKTGQLTVSWRPGPPGSRHTWWQVMDVVKRHRSPANVVLHTDHLTDGQIAWLVRRADCFVSLTRAEGWGIGAFDAAVAGRPVVITGHGGQLDFLGPDHPGLVPFTLVPADHPDRSMFEPGMTWAEPDLDAAADLLRDVVASDRQRRHAETTAPTLRECFGAERVGALMREALR